MDLFDVELVHGNVQISENGLKFTNKSRTYLRGITVIENPMIVKWSNEIYLEKTHYHPLYNGCVSIYVINKSNYNITIKEGQCIAQLTLKIAQQF